MNDRFSCAGDSQQTLATGDEGDKVHLPTGGDCVETVPHLGCISPLVSIIVWGCEGVRV